MKRCCRNCSWSTDVTLSDRIKYHIRDDYRLIICRYNGSVHRRDKEQRKCSNFCERFKVIQEN